MISVNQSRHTGGYFSIFFTVPTTHLGPFPEIGPELIYPMGSHFCLGRYPHLRRRVGSQGFPPPLKFLQYPGFLPPPPPNSRPLLELSGRTTRLRSLGRRGHVAAGGGGPSPPRCSLASPSDQDRLGPRPGTRAGIGGSAGGGGDTQLRLGFMRPPNTKKY